VERTIAVATSAVREAKNGGTFVERVEQETGIVVNVITGEEEARLIYLGARESIDLGNRRVLIVDVGGGSVEFVIGDRDQLLYSSSLKLGVLRLLNRFPLSDPVKSKEMEAIREYIDAETLRMVRRVQELGFDQVLATSGTNLTLLGLALQQEHKDGTTPGTLNNESVPAAKIQAVCKWLERSTTAERRRVAKIQPGRLDSIVVGAILWQCLISELKIKSVTGCSFALREGMLINYMNVHLPAIWQEEKYPDPRRRTVLSLAQRCNWEEKHARHITGLALSLFDQLKPVHGLRVDAREMLEYASLLHDIGYHINARSHHKHGAYLIFNGNLLGFAREEIQMVAAIVRYHRKRKPDRADPELDGFDAVQRRTVEVLAGILRVADGLDRTHFGIVERVTATADGRTIDINALVRGPAELEVWFASQRSGLLQDALHRAIRIRVVENPPKPVGEPEQPLQTNEVRRDLISVPGNGAEEKQGK
jgi:exopolyphosphatase/guanosine-5'-triphosphate,3'-diphosphate pyrophosphatase